MILKRTTRVAAFAFLPFVSMSYGAGRPSDIQPIYVVEGHDTLHASAPAFTIDREVAVMGNPHDRVSLKRAVDAGLAALKATEPLALTPEQEAKYHPSCPQYQDPESAALVPTGPILEPTADCNYGDPQCPNWKTKDRYDCWGAATNCVRKPQPNH